MEAGEHFMPGKSIESRDEQLISTQYGYTRYIYPSDDWYLLSHIKEFWGSEVKNLKGPMPLIMCWGF